ncbi:PaaI family thioesterase [Salisediminibacterium selenitireducens]|uniref:Thioesterase superfamily protein n=1 Tax=Bacillus selenitireducens (strain ATCC 700615 / DSM 15326 / MLS10) TaxID=439292 RepID=D6XVF9_BACIE|nr:PaaI family thioesterase [Salisediminibacterium selenitireducens]ADH99697.1 thioesterase superfamily protein [[Bacillus] selenitireducens MLS10]
MNSKKKMAAIQDYYPDDFAHCYGCGRLNENGMKLRTFWHEDESSTVTWYEPRDNQIAIPGFVYGGLLASFVDCHGTGSAALMKHKMNGFMPDDGEDAPRFVTASLHLDYLKPTPHGETLKAIGSVEEIHPKKFKVTVTVYAGTLHVVNGEVVAVQAPSSFDPTQTKS